MVLYCQYTQGKSCHWDSGKQDLAGMVVARCICSSWKLVSFLCSRLLHWKPKALKKLGDITLRKCYGRRKMPYNELLWGPNVLCSNCENWMLPRETKQRNVKFKSVHITSLVIPNIISILQRIGVFSECPTNMCFIK